MYDQKTFQRPGAIFQVAGQRERRVRTGIDQGRFAKRYRISVGRQRDLEQARTTADSALLAYLAVIDREPDAVNRALGDVRWHAN